MSITKIPHGDVLEGLYKLRMRESEKLKTVLELYDLETQKKLGPDYHRLKAMVKRSIEQEIRNKNFGTRSGNFEKNAVVKNQGTKQRVQEFLDIVGNGKPTGNVGKETIAVSATIQVLSCGRLSENHGGPKVPGEGAPVVESIDGLAKIASKELATTRFLKNGTLQKCLCCKTKSGCRFGEKCSFAHRQVDEQPRTGLKQQGQKCCGSVEKGKLARTRICSRPISRSNGETSDKK